MNRLPLCGTAALRLALPALLTLSCHRGDAGFVEGTGTIEIIEVDIAPMVSARVTRMWVDEGAMVRAGDTLVALAQPTTRPDIDARRARVAAAMAQLEELERGARPAERDRARAELASADADAVRAARDLERTIPLAANGTLPAQQLDAARNAAAATAARRESARQALRLLEEGTRPERIANARAAVADARAGMTGAENAANDLILVAPVAGVVLSRHAEPGEMLAPGEAALTLGDVSRPWVRIFLSPQATAAVRLGDTVSALLDGFPRHPVVGRVVAINTKAEYTPRIALTERERADLLFGVKVQLDDSTGLLKPGLPITVRLAKRTLPSTLPGDRSPPVPIGDKR